MRESIYCSRRRACATFAFFILVLCFVLFIVNIFNTRTLWIQYYYLISFFFFEAFVVWNWFNKFVESIIYNIVVATLAIFNNIFIFVIFFFYCITLRLSFYLKYIIKIYFTNIQFLLQSYVAIVISNTCCLYKNWLKSILLVRNCVNSALCDFVCSLYNCRYLYVIFEIRFL